MMIVPLKEPKMLINGMVKWLLVSAQNFVREGYGRVPMIRGAMRVMTMTCLAVRFLKCCAKNCAVIGIQEKSHSVRMPCCITIVC